MWIIAAPAAAVVVELLRNALHVGRRGIAGDEFLDQLARDERPDVRMIEDVIERILQILRTGLIGGDGAVRQGRPAVGQQAFGAGFVLVGKQLHRLDLVVAGHRRKLRSGVGERTRGYGR